jgi:hypothetical protein
MSRFLTEVITNPFGYVDVPKYPSTTELLTGKSNIPSYAEAQEFWEEAVRGERERVLNEIQTNQKLKNDFNVNRQRIDQEKADGVLNSGGYYLEGTLPMDFDQKMMIEQKIRGQGIQSWNGSMTGGQGVLAKPEQGLQTWIPENIREQIIQQRIQSYEEQTQQAELEDPTVSQDETEIGKIQLSQDKIGSLLRQINTALIGGLIDKSILINLSEIVSILSQYGYGYGVQFLENIRTQLTEDPGMTEIDYLRGHRRKEKNEISTEGQTALIRSIASYTTDMDNDILQPMLSPDFQNLSTDARKLAMKQIIRDFNSKTASLTSPGGIEELAETRQPETTNEAIKQIINYLTQSYMNDEIRPFEILEQFIPINIEQIRELEMTPAEQSIMYNDFIQQLRRIPGKEIYDLWNNLYRFAVSTEPEEEEYEEGEEQLFPSFERQPGILPAETTTLEPLIPPSYTMETLPRGEEESKEETEEQRRGEFTFPEEAMTTEAQTRRTPPPPPRRTPKRPRGRPTRRIEEFFPIRPASATQTQLGEELGERLAEAELE